MIMWRQTTGEHMMQQGPSSFTKKNATLRILTTRARFQVYSFDVLQILTSVQWLPPPKDSIACCRLEWFHAHCWFVVALRWLQQNGPVRKDRRKRTGRIGRADWIMGLSPCWTFWKVDSHRSQDYLTVHLLAFTWFLHVFTILSPPTI